MVYKIFKKILYNKGKKSQIMCHDYKKNCNHIDSVW